MTRLPRQSARARARGRARRRLRYLRRLRELQLRDLGGFLYDLYRFGERREALVRAKFDAIIATDKEIRGLEELLDAGGERRLELFAPGVGGTCPVCGALHASDARYCASCGTALAGDEAVEPLGFAAPWAAESPAPPPADPVAPAGAVEPAPPAAGADTVAFDPANAEGDLAAAPEPEAAAYAPPTEGAADEAAPEPAPEATEVSAADVAAPEPAPEATEVSAADVEEPPLAEPPVADAPPSDRNGGGPRSDESGEVAAVGPPRRSARRRPRRRGAGR